jgi:hypothetical protein
MASALIVSAQNGQALSPCEFDATPGPGTAGDSGAAASGFALLGKSATISPNGPKKSPIKNHPNPLRPLEDAITALKTAKSNAKKRSSILQVPPWSSVLKIISHSKLPAVAAKPAELPLPAVEGLLGDPHLPDDFIDLRSGLSLAQSKGDLLLGKLRFIHAELSSS